ncbi:MAG: ADP-ribosylglycohydrolase family protein [Prevotellaceae bacterium]|nr:ADP-ribosylglycohydrolase family protein [Prevotellaceae bacterium]
MERELTEKDGRIVDIRKMPQAFRRDKTRGCLMAGAMGDALGYPVEFMTRKSILSKYGSEGIRQFELDKRGKAQISDDTQMTLFTANGMMMGDTRGHTRGVGGVPHYYVDSAYQEWYETQTKVDTTRFHTTWLVALPAMAHRRAPGNTCLSACREGFRKPNNSKGCGGIMRVAPAGLMDAYLTLPQVAQAAAYMAELTHKHPLGYLPAALMAVLVRQLLPLSPDTTPRMEVLVNEALDTLKYIHEGEEEDCKQELKDLTLKAMSLAQSDTSDHEAIHQLGEGWTGEEAWAISLFCLVRHIGSPKEAIIAAVNHDGDSDTTGSITGNMIGALHGYKALKRLNLFCPDGHELEQTLELSEIILAIADDLTTGCLVYSYCNMEEPGRQQWFDRYLEMQPAGIKEKD